MVGVQAQVPAGLADLSTLTWSALSPAVAACQACGLCQSRQRTVVGEGPPTAGEVMPSVDWLVVGEVPGEDEEQSGRPFAGAAGQLLDNMLRAVGRSREQQVYLTNAVKCRPPGDRNPTPAELAHCAPYLHRQLALLQPKLVLAMGRFAVQTVLQSNEPIGRLRGRVHQVQGIPVVVTYHPGYLLRNAPDKAKAWADLCLAQANTH